MGRIWNFLKKPRILPCWIKRSAKFVFISLIIMTCLATIAFEIFFVWNIFFSEEEPSDTGEFAEIMPVEEEKCNVQGIKLHGDLLTYPFPTDLSEQELGMDDQVASQDIVIAINDAEKDKKIKAILIEIDSYGGQAVAAEEVANTLKQAQKPTVALIREDGISAAYWAATGADMIFASKNSDVGSIAVTMSYLDFVKQNQKEGITYQQLSSGKFKDAGNPEKPLTKEEKKLIMRDLEILHQNFVRAVAENRNLDIEKVKSLADGSTMLGEMALKNGLIDRVGNLSEVKNYLKEKIGEDIEICW